jgi:dihydroorotate dehydrogenase electron transfer subunit
VIRRDIFHSCPIVSHEDLGSDIFIISLQLKLDQVPLPGTFVHIKVTDNNDPLLRRPFSIYDYDEERGVVDVLYKIFGRGTRVLAKAKTGDVLDVLGPLGNSFVEAESERRLILVGGGVGIPPLYLLAKRCRQKSDSGPQMTFLCGLADTSEQVMAQRLDKLSPDLHYSTDNGTLGYHGLVTDLLKQQLSKGTANDDPLVCACGPSAMLREVSRICREEKVRCLVSLESIMPCGVGTCLGCVVKKSGGDGYYRVCREGPVFPAEEVEL